MSTYEGCQRAPGKLYAMAVAVIVLNVDGHRARCKYNTLEVAIVAAESTRHVVVHIFLLKCAEGKLSVSLGQEDIDRGVLSVLLHIDEQWLRHARREQLVSADAQFCGHHVLVASLHNKLREPVLGPLWRSKAEDLALDLAQGGLGAKCGFNNLVDECSAMVYSINTNLNVAHVLG